MQNLTFSRRRLVPKVLTTLLCGAAVVSAPKAAFAVGEQNGRLAGTITDKVSGEPLPGAKVSVRSGALIGGAKAVLTGDDGTYELIALPPGTYDVELTFEGAKPLRRRVVVRQGETFPLNIAWSVELAAEDKKVIIEERKMVRPDTTQTGTVLTADTQSRVATARTYQSITQQVAGVSGTGGNPNIKGAMDSHNRYMVDGLDITDPVTNTFSANINFDSIASVEVLTGGTEAQYNTLGGVINLVTGAGGNEWHIDSSLYINHQALSAGSQFGSQLYNGARPFAQLARSPQAGYQANLNVGGPILQNKLWVNLSLEFNRVESSINIGPPLSVQAPSRLSTKYLARLKLTYAPSAKHRLTLSASADPATFDNTAQDNYRLGVAQDYQRQGGLFSILQWDYFISDHVNTNVQAGFQWSTIDTGPQGYFSDIDYSGYRGSGKFSPANDMYDRNRPAQTNNDDGTTWYQGGPIALDRRITVQFDPSISVRGNLLGKHEAKFGIQSRFNAHSASVEYPGNSTYINEGGGPGESGLCQPQLMQTAGCNLRSETLPYENSQQGFSVGAFAQDRWQVTKWLRINPGLRLDYGRTQNSVGELVSSLWGIGPRLGLVFDLTGDQKTILTAYYGRSNEVLSLLAAAYADVSAVTTTYKWQPDSQMFEKLRTSGGATGYQLDPTGKTPHTDEITLSLRREVLENSSASIDYTYKRVGNVWDSIEVNQIWDPTGTRVVGHVNDKPEVIYKYTRPDENWRVYQGIDFVLESRPRQEWDFSLVYTLSWLYGPGSEQFAQVSGQQNLSQYYNPRQYHFFDGFLPEDHRHNLKLRASYSWKGLTVGAFMYYQSGAPLTKRFFNQNDGDYINRRSPSGTEPGQTPNSTASITELRLPATLTVDARASYDLYALVKKFHVTLIADVFNVFNLDTPIDLQEQDLPTFGQINSRQRPLRAQLGIRFQY